LRGTRKSPGTYLAKTKDHPIIQKKSKWQSANKTVGIVNQINIGKQPE